MSNRFASCGACARSPTHSRGTSVGQPYWSRSIAVARMQPLVVAPQRITESTPCETRIDARFVPKNAGRALLEHDRLVLARLEPRVDLDPAAAELQVAERRHLLQPEAAVLQAGLEADRREDRPAAPSPRAASSSRFVASTSAVRSEPSAHVGIGEAAAEVDDEHGRARAERDALAEPRLRVDLACLLVAHAGTALAAARQLLAERARA